MRRLSVCALMMGLVFLTACGGEDRGENTDELALDMRGTYLSLSGCTAELELIADYGERVYEYGLSLSYQREGDTTITVTAPEEAAGVTARITGGETFLEYDGASLETGPLDGSGLSPIEAGRGAVSPHYLPEPGDGGGRGDGGCPVVFSGELCPGAGRGAGGWGAGHRMYL